MLNHGQTSRRGSEEWCEEREWLEIVSVYSLSMTLTLPVRIISVGKTNVMGFRDMALCIGHAVKVANDG